MDLSKIQSDVMSKIDTSKLPIGNLEGVTSQIQDAIGNIKLPDISLPVDLGSILGGTGASEIANTFKNPLDLFKNKLPTTDQLSSIAPELEKGLKEAKSKLEALATDASEAIAEPVSFITKPVKESVEGIDSLAGTTGIDKPLDGLDSTISNISKSIGSAIGSAGELSSAISSVTNGLANSLGSFNLGDIANNLGVTDFIGSIESSIGGVIGDITGGISDITSSFTDAFDSLPSELKGLVDLSGLDGIDSVINKYLGDQMGVISELTGKLDGIVSGDKIASLVFGNSTNNVPNITDLNGNDVSHLFGDNSKSDIEDIYTLVQSICPGIEIPELWDFKFDKSIFDALLGISVDLNLNELLEKLALCAQEKNGLYDDNSINTLRNSTQTVARSGNVAMYENVQNLIGVHNYYDPTTEVKVLAANMTDTDTNVDAYGRVMDTFGLTVQDVVSDQVGEHLVYDANTVTFMSATGTRIIDSVMSADDRELMYGLMTA